MLSNLHDINGSWTNASRVATRLSLFSRNTHMTFAEERREESRREEKGREEKKRGGKRREEKGREEEGREEEGRE